MPVKDVPDVVAAAVGEELTVVAGDVLLVVGMAQVWKSMWWQNVADVVVNGE